MRAMAVPTFAAVVDQSSRHAAARRHHRELRLLRSAAEGSSGVKSGFTQAAMGCLVLAADREVGGTRRAGPGGRDRPTRVSTRSRAANRADELLVERHWRRPCAPQRSLAAWGARGNGDGTVDGGGRAARDGVGCDACWHGPATCAHVGFAPGRLQPGSPAGAGDGVLTVSLRAPSTSRVPVRHGVVPSKVRPCGGAWRMTDAPADGRLRGELPWQAMRARAPASTGEPGPGLRRPRPGPGPVRGGRGRAARHA